MFQSYVREVKNVLLDQKNLSLAHLGIIVLQQQLQVLIVLLPIIALEVLTTISSV